MDGVTTEVETTDQADPVLAASIDVARAAAVEVGADSVGMHLATLAEDEHVVSHAFEATLPGYRGWMWVVSLARVADSDHVTIDEVVLLPGEGSLLAPEWVPWQERVRRGDLGPGDLLPTSDDDARLVPA